MPILDTDKILNGTDTKQLIHAYENLKSSYSNDSAKSYCAYYKGKPLSFILKNARYIIAEPQFGLPFIKWVATSFPLMYTATTNLTGCLNSYIDEYGSRMSPQVKDLYTDAYNVICNAVSKNFSSCSASKDDCPEMDLFIDTLYSELCKKRMENGDENAVKFFDGHSPYDAKCEDLSAFLKGSPKYEVLIHATPYATELCIESTIYESVLSLMTNEDGFENKSKNLVACETVQFLALSKNFKESVNHLRNGNLRSLLTGMMNADIPGELIGSFKEAVDDTINPIYSSSMSAVNSIMEESVYDDIYKEDRENVKSGINELKLSVYESVRQNVHNLYMVMEETDILPETNMFTVIKESMGVTGEITVGDAYKLITEAVAEAEANNKYFFESGKDGAVNKVIGKTHTIFGEGKNAITKKAVNSQVDDDVVEDDNKELPKSTKVDSSDLPDSSNPNSTKPQKPKQGLIGKIQNAGMEAHKKSRLMGAKIRQMGTSVKNAGKSVLKIPSGLIDSLKGVIKGFDEMDDNRRKQYMLQPGYRKKIFKNLRIAATYGLAAYTNWLLVPITWFGRRLSKEKNKRIRNEFARELETEIKICEEKINDANSRDDKQEKYQLMRIRDALAREKERVSTNGKYI